MQRAAFVVFVVGLCLVWAAQGEVDVSEAQCGLPDLMGALFEGTILAGASEGATASVVVGGDGMMSIYVNPGSSEDEAPTGYTVFVETWNWVDNLLSLREIGRVSATNELIDSPCAPMTANYSYVSDDCTSLTLRSSDDPCATRAEMMHLLTLRRLSQGPNVQTQCDFATPADDNSGDVFEGKSVLNNQDYTIVVGANGALMANSSRGDRIAMRMVTQPPVNNEADVEIIDVGVSSSEGLQACGTNETGRYRVAWDSPTCEGFSFAFLDEPCTPRRVMLDLLPVVRWVPPPERVRTDDFASFDGAKVATAFIVLGSLVACACFSFACLKMSGNNTNNQKKPVARAAPVAPAPPPTAPAGSRDGGGAFV